jgi:hypothetical protein
MSVAIHDFGWHLWGALKATFASGSGQRAILSVWNGYLDLSKKSSEDPAHPLAVPQQWFRISTAFNFGRVLSTRLTDLSWWSVQPNKRQVLDKNVKTAKFWNAAVEGIAATGNALQLVMSSPQLSVGMSVVNVVSDLTSVAEACEESPKGGIQEKNAQALWARNRAIQISKLTLSIVVAAATCGSCVLGTGATVITGLTLAYRVTNLFAGIHKNYLDHVVDNDPIVGPLSPPVV